MCNTHGALKFDPCELGAQSSSERARAAPRKPVVDLAETDEEYLSEDDLPRCYRDDEPMDEP